MICGCPKQVSLENGKQASEKKASEKKASEKKASEKKASEKKASEKKASEWISVSERLPEEDVDVLTRRATGIDVEHYMGNGKWWNDYYSGRWTVTHWMPMPSTEGLNEARL